MLTYIESMPRVRVRPTREETRQRLFEGAAEVFTTQGIGAASVESITSAAGFTRGAFYSNFDTKDELIAAMLADHVEQTTRRHLELLATHRDPSDFIQAVRAMDRSTQDPLGRSPLLHIEVLLYVARRAERRPEIVAPLRARREFITELVRTTAGEHPIDAELVGAMFMAMEDGFRLHQLIDPDGTPADSFMRSVSALQQLLNL